MPTARVGVATSKGGTSPSPPPKASSPRFAPVASSSNTPPARTPSPRFTPVTKPPSPKASSSKMPPARTPSPQAPSIGKSPAPKAPSPKAFAKGASPPPPSITASSSKAEPTSGFYSSSSSSAASSPQRSPPPPSTTASSSKNKPTSGFDSSSSSSAASSPPRSPPSVSQPQLVSAGLTLPETDGILVPWSTSTNNPTVVVEDRKDLFTVGLSDCAAVITFDPNGRHSLTHVLGSNFTHALFEILASKNALTPLSTIIFACGLGGENTFASIRGPDGERIMRETLGAACPPPENVRFMVPTKAQTKNAGCDFVVEKSGRYGYGI